jgi:hypothetical protein
MCLSTEEVSVLQDRLKTVCHSIINLMPEEARNILRSYSDCKSRSDSWHWHKHAARMIMKLAEVLPPELSGNAARAYCPLCGESATYEEGFKLPEGLRRHLIGWGRAQSQCPVFNAADELAHMYWKVSFQEEDQAADAETLRKRRMSETLYYVGPDEPMELVDEGFYFRRARCQEELTWAEDRLSQFGFETVIEGNVKSYIISSETFIVYADPREIGEIRFNVYMKSSPKRTSRHEVSGFGFKDKWNNDICQKFQSRLLKATKEPDDPFFRFHLLNQASTSLLPSVSETR